MMFSDRLDVSLAERRELATFPVTTSGMGLLDRFPGEFEEWFNDHFGMREALVRSYNRIRVQWIGISSSEWVLVGDDGWLFQAGAPHIEDMRNSRPYSDIELQYWIDVLGQKHDWLRTQGISYLFLVTPNKHLVYPEFLPGQINQVRPESRLDQLMSWLEEYTDVPSLDLTDELLLAKQELSAYHKTDTHWNAWGAYRGYRRLLGALAANLPGIVPLQFSTADFEAVDRPGGDLADGLAMAEMLREQDIRLKHDLPRCARNIGIPEDADEGVMHENIFSTECESGSYRLLILRDSYAVALIPYLADTFEHVDYFTASPVSFEQMVELVEKYRPDVVIEQRSSRWLRGPEG